MKNEASIERAVCEYARKKGWLAMKFESPSRNGVPDRTLMREGVVIFIEFKTKKGRLSKIQKYTIDEFKSHKMNVFVVDNIEEGKKIIDEYTQRK